MRKHSFARCATQEILAYLIVMAALFLTVGCGARQPRAAVPEAPRAEAPGAPGTPRQAPVPPTTQVPVATPFSIAFSHDGQNATHFRLFEDPPGTTTPKAQVQEMPVSALVNGEGIFKVTGKSTVGNWLYSVLARNAPPNMAATDSPEMSAIAAVFVPTATVPLPVGNIRIIVGATVSPTGTISNFRLEAIQLVGK